jgi:peptidyl-prolyl cis-trans isomerase C
MKLNHGYFYRGGTEARSFSIPPSLCLRASVVAILFLGASCSREEPVQEPEGVVARIGGRFITEEDLQAEAQRRMENGRPVPAKEELLDNMLANQALVIRAQKEGLADEPEIRREIERLLARRLRERDLVEPLKAIEVSAEEVRAEYERRLDDYTRPGMDRFAMLHLKLEPNATEMKQSEVRARMEDARTMMLQQPGKDFGKLAINYSDDQLSRYRGGDVGWIAVSKTTSRLPTEVLTTARTLKKGAMGKIAETDNGLYLVMKTDTRPSETTPLEQMHATLHKRLIADRRRAVEAKFIDMCMKQATPEIDSAALAEFTLKPILQEPERPSINGGIPVAGY